MQRILCVGLLVTSCAAAVGTAHAAEPQQLNSKVREVTVFSDRARVTRSAVADVSQSAVVYSIAKLPGWVDDGSVRVALLPADAGRITDVRVERDYLARPDDDAQTRAEGEVRAIAAEIAAIDDELAILAAQAEQIEGIKAFSLEKLSAESAVRTIEVQSYGEVVNFISESLRETARARRAAMAERARLAPELAAKQRRLAELNALTQLEQTTVLVTVVGQRSTSATLEVTYLLPGATWEPTHELRVSADQADTAELTSFAVVTQTSGEDWEGATLSFATQSSERAVRIPQLEALTLGDTQTATRIVQRQISSFHRARQAFVGQNRLWNQVHVQSSSRTHSQQVYDSNFQYLNVVQAKTVQIFESLQRRGTSAHFKSDGPRTVRSDGHSVRVPIGRATLSGAQRIVAAPEQSLNAARVLEMSNSGAQALLPGKVALYQDGAFLGMTDVNFIAEGERFSLFLGVADRIKLSRRLDRTHSSIARRSRTRMQVAFVVTVENLGAAPTSLTLADRVPVSQNREIKVDQIDITGDAKPDSKGLLSWSITLAPGEKRSFRVAYRVEYPPTLVLQTRAARRARARAPSPAASPAASSPDYPIEEQLMDLEEEF